MAQKTDSIIEFRELKVPANYGKACCSVYHVIENGRAIVMENFGSLTSDMKDFVKDLICRMAINENFKSPKIKNSLRGYSYGEIRPLPHRFFFFRSGNNLIFFAYVEKKKDSFDDSFYRELNKRKERYERAFKESR